MFHFHPVDYVLCCAKFFVWYSGMTQIKKHFLCFILPVLWVWVIYLRL
jgi:hypothetical protein